MGLMKYSHALSTFFFVLLFGFPAFAAYEVKVNSQYGIKPASPGALKLFRIQNQETNSTEPVREFSALNTHLASTDIEIIPGQSNNQMILIFDPPVSTYNNSGEPIGGVTIDVYIAGESIDINVPSMIHAMGQSDDPSAVATNPALPLAVNPLFSVGVIRGVDTALNGDGSPTTGSAVPLNLPSVRLDSCEWTGTYSYTMRQDGAGYNIQVATTERENPSSLSYFDEEGAQNEYSPYANVRPITTKKVSEMREEWRVRQLDYGPWIKNRFDKICSAEYVRSCIIAG